MSQLRYPLKDRLHDPVTERALQRVWRGIDERAPRRPKRPIRALALALLALLAGVGLGLALRKRDAGRSAGDAWERVAPPPAAQQPR
jgi:hypothetical protein